MPVELSDSYETIYRRALMEMAAGKSDEAIETMLRIVNRLRRLRPETLQRKPDLQEHFANAWILVTQFMRWEKRYDQAIATTQGLLDHLPDPDEGRRRIASLRIAKGEVEEGLAQMQQIAEEKSDFDSWSDLGLEFQMLTRYDEAISCYRSALKHADSNEEAAAANLALLQVHQQSGQVDEVLQAWNMAVVLDPDLSEQAAQVYGWLIRRGELERAAKYLNRERNPLQRAFYQGLLDEQAGRHDVARQQWQKVLDMEAGQAPFDLEAWMEAALRLGEPQKASEQAQQMLRATSTLPTGAGVLLGIALLMEGQIDQAKGAFAEAVQRLQRSWPPRHAIPAERWSLLCTLVDDETLRQEVGTYFEH